MERQDSSAGQQGFPWQYTNRGTNSRPINREFAPSSDPSSSRQFQPPMTEPDTSGKLTDHIRALVTTRSQTVSELSREWAPSKTKWRMHDKQCLWRHMHTHNFYASEKDVEPAWLDQCLEIFGSGISRWPDKDKKALKKRIKSQIAKSTQQWVKDGLIEQEQSGKHYHKTAEFQAKWEELIGQELPFQSLGGGKAMDIHETVNDEVIEVPDDEEEEDEDYVPPVTPRPRRELGSTLNASFLGSAHESSSSSHLVSPPPTGSKRPATEGEGFHGQSSNKRSKIVTLKQPPPKRGSIKNYMVAQKNDVAGPSSDARSKRNKGKEREQPVAHDSDNDEVELPTYQQMFDTTPAPPGSPGTLVDEPQGPFPTSWETIRSEPRANETGINEPQANEAEATETGADEQLANEMQINEPRDTEPQVTNPPPTSPVRQPPPHHQPQPSLMIVVRDPKTGRLEASQKPYDIEDLISKRRTQSAESFFAWYQSESGVVDEVRKLRLIFPGQQDVVHKWEIERGDEANFRRMSTIVWMLKQVAVAQDEAFVVLVEPLGDVER